MIDAAKYKERVWAGIDVLDKIDPDWRVKVDRDQLNLHNPSYCVLGHVFGDYWSGGQIILEEVNGRKVPMNQDAMAELAFDLEREEREDLRAKEGYDELTSLWLQHL